MAKWQVPGLRTLADVTRPTSLASAYRRRRFELFRSLVSPLPRPVRILDVGGSPEFWERVGLGDDEQIRVVVLNQHLEGQVHRPNMQQEVGDARAMPYGDLAFDVIVSNSVIEHVGGFEDQKRMAEEIRRVGRRYFVETPNRYFPIEPHFLFPLFQFLPIPIRAGLLSRFRLGWYAKQEKAAALATVRSIRLVSARELRFFFPQGTLHREKFCGMTKALVIYGGW